jgi:hypothetical protein
MSQCVGDPRALLCSRGKREHGSEQTGATLNAV